MYTVNFAMCKVHREGDSASTMIQANIKTGHQERFYPKTGRFRPRPTHVHLIHDACDVQREHNNVTEARRRK